MKQIATLIFIILSTFAYAQTKIDFNKEYTNIKIDSVGLIYKLHLEKGVLYKFTVLQKGVDVVLVLTDKSNKKILEKDSPNGLNGPETFEYTPTDSKEYSLTIKKLEEPENPAEGKLSVYIKKYSKAEMQLREKIKKELEGIQK